ncbi:MAG: ATP synthase F1 subunit epsilon [bacterium]
MKLYIYKIDRILYEGDADVITLPTESGEISVLENHIPLITHLAPGKISIKIANETQEFSISGGFAEIKPHKAIILAN